MTTHKHEPISEEAMNWISPQDTICETIRQAYHRIDDQEARLKLREATAMAKAMTTKLQEYNRNWKAGFFDDNQSFPAKRDRRPIDVLFIAWDDNANTGYRFRQCAKYLGLNSIMVKGKAHAFGYPQQAPIHPSLASEPIAAAPITVMAPGLEGLMKSARVIHLIASTYPLVAFNWRKANVIVQHGGTVYRQHPVECNEVFNAIGAKKTIIQCPDLLGLGAVNESWIYYPIDTLNIPFKHADINSKIVIGHFPSNAAVKGTDDIAQVLNQFKGICDVRIDTNRVDWMSNMLRMSECDIIVEGCNAKQGNKVYGEWGNTALEASAMGCAVVTHCLSIEKYKLEFGEFGPGVANSPEALKSSLDQLVQDRQHLMTARNRCLMWAKTKHSIPATANRLWDLVYKDFF